ncbi:MAG: M20 family metallopeptidase [Actinomycetota bacterium]
MVTSDLLIAADAVHADVVALRREIHREPEIGLHLPRTAERVLRAIDGLGLRITTGETTSGIVADLEGDRPGPTVLLRGDMDALPMPEDTGLEFASAVEGAMHACGHDAHTAMLAGAARVLAGRRDRLAGRVRFMFQPGEEGYHGARYMIEEGVLDGVDGAYALHILPNVPVGTVVTRPGPIMASADKLHFTVTGRGGHASTPYSANDPMPVAAEIIQALQTLVTRKVDPFDPVVVSVTQVNAGTTNNVIPEVVRMHGTLRTVSERARTRITQRMKHLVAAIGSAHEMTAELEAEDLYPVTVNDPGETEAVLRVARTVLGPDRGAVLPTPVMGAEDFSYVLAERPGALAYLGVCPPGVRPSEAPSCHSNRMMLDEEGMRSGVALLAALAEDFLARGGAAG